MDEVRQHPPGARVTAPRGLASIRTMTCRLRTANSSSAMLWRGGGWIRTSDLRVMSSTRKTILSTTKPADSGWPGEAFDGRSHPPLDLAIQREHFTFKPA